MAAIIPGTLSQARPPVSADLRSESTLTTPGAQSGIFTLRPQPVSHQLVCHVLISLLSVEVASILRNSLQTFTCNLWTYILVIVTSLFVFSSGLLSMSLFLVEMNVCGQCVRVPCRSKCAMYHILSYSISLSVRIQGIMSGDYEVTI